MRRLNRVPVLIAGGGIALAISAVGYTYWARAAANAAANAADLKRAEASKAEILKEAPLNGEIRAATFRQPAPPPPPPAAPSVQTTTTTQTIPAPAPPAPVDEMALQARKQAWLAYYQQIAAANQLRIQTAASALAADTATPASLPVAAQGGGSGLDAQIAAARGDALDAQTAAAGMRAGGGGASANGFGGGVPGFGGGGGFAPFAPAVPDTSGAREKLAFTNQVGDLGQDDTLHAVVRDAISPYLVTAGDVIPCVAINGENSDTPGQFVGRVSRNVYDSATGRFLLIPQGAKVIGSYDVSVTAGQTRIPTVITRIIFPDSSSIPLGAMPAADQSGFAGLHDQVDTHLWAKFSNAILLAAASAGIQISQGTGGQTNGYNAQQIGAASIGQQFGQLGQEFARAGLAIPNTITIRNGYEFVVQVTKDMVLRPYVDRRDATAMRPVNLGAVLQ